MFTGFDLITERRSMSFDTPFIDDIVNCRIKEARLVTQEEAYDDKISLKIIGYKESTFGTQEYVVFIPEYQLNRVIPEGKVTQRMCKDYGVNPKFINDHMTYIRKSHVVSFEWRCDGMHCNKCDDYFEKAESNQADGTMTCWSCRQNPWR
jgi:hypothetical protein